MTSRSEQGNEQLQGDNPAAARCPSQVEIFAPIATLSQAEIFALPTSGTYEGGRLPQSFSPGREQRRRTLNQLLGMLRAARDRHDDWYVWVVEERASRRTASPPAVVNNEDPADDEDEKTPQRLRGPAADEAALRYLGNALDDGCWHELEGLWILARAQGIPRRAFDWALSTFGLELARRGAFEEWSLRLAPEGDEAGVLAEIEALVRTGVLQRLEGDGDS